MPLPQVQSASRSVETDCLSSKLHHPLECLACHQSTCDVSVTRYSCLHRFQKLSARHCTCFHWFLWRSLRSKSPGGAVTAVIFWMRIIAGISIVGLSGSVDTGVNGLAFKMAMTSAISVVNSLCVRWLVSDRSKFLPESEALLLSVSPNNLPYGMNGGRWKSTCSPVCQGNLSALD